MKLHYIPITILLIGAIFLGSFAYLNELNTNYDTTTTDFNDLNNSFTVAMDDLNEDSQALSNNITGLLLAVQEGELFDIPYQFYQVAWGTGKTFFKSLAVEIALLNEITDVLNQAGIPLPYWVLSTITIIMMFIVIAIIAYGFFKWKFED